MLLPEERPEPTEPGALRWPAFLWSVLHVPVFLWLFAGPIAQSLRGVPEGFRAATWPSFPLQAGALALALWVVTLPFSLSPRAYRWAVPLVTGLATIVLAIDARTYAAVGFHINGFFLRVAMQPAALTETGIPLSDVLVFGAQGLGWLVGELVLGGWFLRRFTARNRAWAWALALLLACAAERTWVASLSFFGGPGVFAAGQALPLQVPVRMSAIWERITGRQALSSPLEGVAGESALKLPPGVPPAEIVFERKPDVDVLCADLGVCRRAPCRVRGPLDRGCAGGEPGPEGDDADVVAHLHPSLVDRLGEGDRHRRGRGVPVAVQVDEHLLHRQAEALGDRLDDPDVRLVRDEQ